MKSLNPFLRSHVDLLALPLQTTSNLFSSQGLCFRLPRLLQSGQLDWGAPSLTKLWWPSYGPLTSSRGKPYHRTQLKCVCNKNIYIYNILWYQEMIDNHCICPVSHASMLLGTFFEKIQFGFASNSKYFLYLPSFSSTLKSRHFWPVSAEGVKRFSLSHLAQGTGEFTPKRCCTKSYGRIGLGINVYTPGKQQKKRCKPWVFKGFVERKSSYTADLANGKHYIEGFVYPRLALDFFY